MTNTLLKLNQLVVGYSTPLVSDINIQVHEGEIIAIVGPSGIGKTTIIRTIGGLIRPIDGSVEVLVEPRGGLGYVPQKLGLVRHASVEHNITLGAISSSHTIQQASRFRSIGLCILIVSLGIWFFKNPFAPPLFFLGCMLYIPSIIATIVYTNQLKKTVVKQAMEDVGLTEKRLEPVRRLSGGQQRRVATARTLAQSPSLIVADEFLSELDQANAMIVLNAMRKLTDAGSSMIMVEHNIERARSVADRIWTIKDGSLVQEVIEHA
ncbi:MAG: hypothetical protein CMA63_00740 [Euryarchaeota archaeon]|nr:hypothetical protein [Euryarchaeota archaeon]